MEIEIGQLFRSIRRWWWVAVVSTVVFAMAGAGASFLSSTTYSSTTQLLVTSPTNDDSILSDSHSASTYEHLVNSGPVLDRVILELGLEYDRADLLELITITTIGNQIIEIEVTTDDPQLSADIANSISRNFVAQATDLSIGELERRLSDLQGQAESLRDQVVVIDTRIEQIDPNGDSEDPQVRAEVRQLDRDRLRISQTLADIEGTIRDINTALSTTSIPVTVTDSAFPAETGQGISPLLLGLLGAFLGGLIGIAVIMYFAVADRYLRDVSQMVLQPVIASGSREQLTGAESPEAALLLSKLGAVARAAEIETIAVVTPRLTSGSEAMLETIQETSTSIPAKIIIAPGVLEKASSIEVLKEADGAVVIATQNESRLADLDEVAELLDMFKIRTVGSVLIKD